MSGWVSCKVADIAAPVKNALVGGPFGSNLVSRDYVDNGIPVIRGQNMDQGRWVGGAFAFVSEVKASELSSNTARPGDLVFTQRGTLGQVAMVPPSPYDRYIVSQSQMKLTVDQAKADALFVYYFFSSAEQQDYIRRNAVQTGVPHTNLEHLRETPILLPPIAEQRAIAHILGSLDDKIELNRQMNATLEAMARALFRSWFVDFDPVRAKAAGRQPVGMDAATAALFPDSFEPSPLGEVPKGWRVGYLPEFIEVDPPRAMRKGEVAPYVEMADLPTASARVAGWRDREYTSGSRFTNGDVLLARITPCLENGKTALVDFLNGRQIGWGSTEFIVLAAKPPLGTPFVYCLARSEEFRTFAIQNMNGSSGRQRVPASCFGGHLLASPPASVAEAFARASAPMFESIRANDEEAKTLAEIRDGLLPRLLAGEIGVIRPQDEQEEHDAGQ